MPDTACARVEGTGCGWIVSPQPGPTCAKGDSTPSDTGETGMGGVVTGGSCIGPAISGCGAPGACSVAPGAPGLFVLIALVAAVRRHARTLGVLLVAGLALPRAAWAGVDAQLLSPLDGGTFPVLREAVAGGAWEPAGAVSVSWAHGLVDYTAGDTHVGLLQQVVTTEAAASLRLGHILRVGVAIPTHHDVIWRGAPVADRWGDLSLWTQVPITEKPGGLATSFYTQVDFATGTPYVYLGDPNGAVHGILAASYDLGPWQVLANAGARLALDTPIPGEAWGSRWEYGLGVHRPLFWRLVANLELFGSASVKPTQSLGDKPVELTGTVGLDLGHGLFVHVGGGAGLSTGLGSPDARLVTVLDWRRRAYVDRDGDGIIDLRDACPDEPEDLDGLADADGCPEDDLDHDGILDPADLCPKDPETANGFQDNDGCPDALTDLTVTVHTESDEPPLDHATVTIGGMPAFGALADDPTTVAIAPGRVEIAATADGFVPFDTWVTVPPGAHFRQAITLEPFRFGDVTLHLVGPDGAPIGGYVRRGTGAAPLELVATEGRSLHLPVGAVHLTASAPGHTPRAVDVDVRAAEHLDVTVVLAPSALQVVGSRIETDEQVRFALDSAAIDPGGEGPLDDLAALLLADPRIELLRVEGHADERGTSRYNLELSRERAATIRDWLIAAGVAPERLEAIGTGEARPASEGESASRRVEFTVLVWADADGEAAPPAPPTR